MVQFGPLVKRLRHRPFTAVTGVRFSHGSLTWCHSQEVRHGTATPPPPVQIWVAPLKTSHQDDGTFFVVFAAYLRTRIIDQKCKYFATTLPVSVFSQTKMSVKNSPQEPRQSFKLSHSSVFTDIFNKCVFFCKCSSRKTTDILLLKKHRASRPRAFYLHFQLAPSITQVTSIKHASSGRPAYFISAYRSTFRTQSTSDKGTLSRS